MCYINVKITLNLGECHMSSVNLYFCAMAKRHLLVDVRPKRIDTSGG